MIPPGEPPGDAGHEARRAELVSSLGRLRVRVADACEAAGRNPSAVTVVVVTKTYPVRDLAILATLGVRDLGEAREQELRDKRAALDPLPTAPRSGSPGDDAGLRWHLVGRLQRNKARSVGRLASVVHSVDRSRLVAPLAQGSQESGGQLECFAQVSLDGDADRGGVLIDDLLPLCQHIDEADGLRLSGLMAVAPVDGDPARAFARLQELSAMVVAEHPTATMISAGMSADLEQAIAHGATHLRVGAAVLGSRPPLV